MNQVATSLDTISLIALGVIVFLLSYSAYTEVKDNKIPNWLTYSGIVLGLTLGILPGGLSMSESVIGFLVGFLSLFVFYMSGGLGGGDVKLMGAFGALFGFPVIVRILIYSSFIGAVMAITLVVWKTDPWDNFKKSLNKKKGAEEPKAETETEEKKPIAVPFGLAICAGVLLSLFANLAV
jgi:prepilin peptidase CpaA